MHRQRLPYYILFVLLLCLGGMTRRAQAQVPIGKEFIVTLPPVVTLAERNDTTIRFSIEILCSRQTMVSIRWPNGTYLINNATIAAGNRFYVTKPLLQLFQIMQYYENNRGNDTVNDRALIVSTDQPVSVHITYSKPYRTETWTVPPTSTYGTSYIVGTMTGNSELADRSGFTITAVENGTVVTIKPKQRARFSHLADTAYQVVLNRYQAYSTVSIDPKGDPVADLTGTTVTANKPIGLTSMAYSASAPWVKSVDLPGGGGTPPQPPPQFYTDGVWTAKTLVEPELPDSMAGTLYYTGPFKRQRFSWIRVMATADSTHLDTNDHLLKEVVIVKRGEFHQFPIYGPIKIHSDKPVIIWQMSVSGDTSGIDTTVNRNGRDTVVRLMYGDPSMVFLYPAPMFRPALQWISPNLSQHGGLPRAPQIPFYWEHYVRVIAPASAANGGVKLDGQPVTFDETFPDGQYVTAVIPINPAPHLLEADVPISAIPYGFTLNDSYSTLASEALRSVAKLSADTLRFVTCDREFDTTITIQSLGNNTFKIDSIRATGLDVKVLTPSTYPSSYLPQTSGPITVVVKIPQAGTYTGSLLIYTDANNRKVFEVPIIAVRDSARLVIPGSTVDFGVLNGSQTSRDSVLKIRNDGTRPLVLQPPTLTGAGFQVISPKTAITIPPGGVDSIVVRFNPSGEGLREGTIKLVGNPCMTPITIALSGFKGAGASLQVQRTLNYQSYLCSVPESVDSTIVLKSIGDEAVTITSTLMGGANAAEFALLENLTGAVINPRDSIKFHVRYTPKGYGYRTASLQLTTTAANAPTISIDLFARRDTAGLLPSTTTIEFSQRTPCEGAADTVLLLTNNGTVPDTITTIDLGGSTAYTLDPMPSPTNPIIIFPNGSQPVKVTFSETTPGSFPATMRIMSQPCGVTATVALGASRVAPSLIAESMALQFDTLYGCQAPVTRQVRLTNNGPIPDTVYTSSITGSAAFTYQAPGQLIIAPGETKTIDVSFSPTGDQAQLGELTLGWKPCDLPMKIALSGTVLTTTASFSAASIDFGQVKTNTPATQTIVLRNTGSAPRRVTASGLPAGVRILSPDLPTVIAGGDSITLQVEWTEGTAGAYTQPLALTLGDPCGTTIQVPMTLTAVGEDILPIRFTISIPNVTGTVNQEVAIPVLISDGANLDKLTSTSMHLRIRHRYTVLAPKRVSTSLPGMTATMSDSRIDGDDRVIDIDLAGGALPSQGEIARIESLVLIGDRDNTPLVVDSVGMTFPAGPPFETLTLTKQDGRFDALGICLTGGERLVTMDGALKVNAVRPNPFRSGTTIEFETTEPGDVRVVIVDARGAHLATLVDGELPAGTHQSYFDASQLSSGLYFCELRKGALVQRVPMIIVQ